MIKGRISLRTRGYNYPLPKVELLGQRWNIHSFGRISDKDPDIIYPLHQKIGENIVLSEKNLYYEFASPMSMDYVLETQREALVSNRGVVSKPESNKGKSKPPIWDGNIFK